MAYMEEINGYEIIIEGEDTRNILWKLCLHLACAAFDASTNCSAALDLFENPTMLIIPFREIFGANGIHSNVFVIEVLA